MPNRTIIVGGGLAGLTCAKTLAERGNAVELFEGQPFLGGRASTFRDADGDWIEQGIHLFLGTYSEFKKVLREIGQDPKDILLWMDQVRYQDLDGTEAVFGTNPLTSPIKTLLGFLGQNDYLGPLDKATLLPIAGPAVRTLEGLRENFDDRTVTQWWEKMHGTENLMERFIRPFCRAIQFTDADDFSAYCFLGWLHHVVYDLPHSFASGYKGAREEIIFRPFARYLESKGVKIRTGVELGEILFDAEKNAIGGFAFKDGSKAQGDDYVVAIPAWSFKPLIPPPLRAHPFFKGIEELPVAPAIAVQIWFDRKLFSHSDFILVANCPVPVYQDQSHHTYPSAGSRLSITISPADSYLDHDDDELVALALENLTQAYPDLREGKVTKTVVLKHRHHLIRPLPGAMSARPMQNTPVANLFLAGDWTQQVYFGSQEGAVRGGLACAEKILAKYEKGSTR